MKSENNKKAYSDRIGNVIGHVIVGMISGGLDGDGDGGGGDQQQDAGVDIGMNDNNDNDARQRRRNDIENDIIDSVREGGGGNSSSIRTNQGALMLPSQRSVSNCCAICLESYKIGEKVIWSTNFNYCLHAFHKDCMVNYLAEVMKKHKVNANGELELPCPICRQQFLHVKE